MKQNRRRYIYFRVHQDGPHIDGKQLSNAIWKSILSLYGEIVVADARFYLNQYDPISGKGYFQCNAARLDLVLAACALIESINGTQVSIQPIRTSGTIRALLKKSESLPR